jgi:hypothetical protein
MTTAPITLVDFKAFLSWPSADTSKDAALQTVLNDATELVEAAVGPMVAASKTDIIRDVSWNGSFQLRTWPVLSVTSITDHFTSVVLNLTNVDIDLRTGVVCGVPWSRAYDVVSSCGRNPVPEPLQEAVRVVGEQLWQSRRGPSNLTRFVQSGVPNTDSAPVYRGYAWPNRAIQLCEPYRLLTV